MRTRRGGCIVGRPIEHGHRLEALRRWLEIVFTKCTCASHRSPEPSVLQNSGCPNPRSELPRPCSRTPDARSHEFVPAGTKPSRERTPARGVTAGGMNRDPNDRGMLTHSPGRGAVPSPRPYSRTSADIPIRGEGQGEGRHRNPNSEIVQNRLVAIRETRAVLAHQARLTPTRAASSAVGTIDRDRARAIDIPVAPRENTAGRDACPPDQTFARAKRSARGVTAGGRNRDPNDRGMLAHSPGRGAVPSPRPYSRTSADIPIRGEGQGEGRHRNSNSEVVQNRLVSIRETRAVLAHRRDSSHSRRLPCRRHD